MDTNPRDLRLLLTLDALLSEGSVTRAAQRLGVSQPALSAQLTRLRVLFGDPMFVMSGRRMVPTTRAETVREPLQRLLRDLDGLVREHTSFDPATTSETVRLGGTDYVHAVVSSGLLARLSGKAPGLRAALLPFDAERVWQELETGRIDAAIVTTFVVLNQAKARFLLREDFVLVQRKGHPRGSAPPDLAEFCALDHILVSPEGGGFFGAIDRALEAMDRKRRVAVSLPSFLLAPAVLGQSDLVCVFPRRLAQAHARFLDLLPLPFAVPSFDLQLIWHPRRQHDPAHVWFRTELADHARQRAAAWTGDYGF